MGELEERMREAARKFEFEKAAQLRDRIKELRTRDVTGVGVYRELTSLKHRNTSDARGAGVETLLCVFYRDAA